MATLTVTAPVAYDMRFSPPELNHYEPISGTSTRVTLDWDGDRIIFIGNSFAYNAGMTAVTGGTVTRFEERESGSLILSITGVSVPATTVQSFFNNNDPSGLAARALNSGDSVTGNSGNDHLFGYSGNDTVNGNGGNDVLGGGNGNDTVNGGNGNDTLSGNDGADTLNGNAGSDILNGNAGNDVLRGGSGSDRHTGGSGADRLDFDGILETGLTAATRDRIMDFTRSQGDKIDLSTIDANVGVAGNQAFQFIGAAAFVPGSAAGKLRYDAVGDILYGSTDADAAAEFSIQLNNLSGMQASDFIL